MNVADQLNDQVKCKLAPSKVHGVGVFAIRDIKKGERLYCNLFGTPRDLVSCDLKDLRPEVRELVIQRWATALDGFAFLNPNLDAHLLSFMNHDEAPNYDNYNDCSLSDIKRGEEIFEDYGVYTQPLLSIK